MSGIASRVGKLEALLRPRPPGLLAGVAWRGVAYSLLWASGQRDDDAAVPVDQLPEGCVVYESDPANEILLVDAGSDGRACPTKRVVGVGWVDVFCQAPRAFRLPGGTSPAAVVTEALADARGRALRRRAARTETPEAALKGASP
jgi:hypothetical protein